MTPQEEEHSGIYYSASVNNGEHDNYEDDALEFRQFCESNEKLRQHPGNATVLTDVCLNGIIFDSNTLVQLFSLVLILGIGVLIREFLRRFLPSIPYTVAIFFAGLGVGRLAAWTCPLLEDFVALVHLKPEIILSTFLPILIFESGFSINIHVFRRTLSQILLLAGPGLLFSTLVTAFCGIFLFLDYKWNWVEASLFGSIVSATDPVAVVGLLRELGAPESLSVLIEGESLLNDGIAVLLFKIFEEILTHQSTSNTDSHLSWDTILVSGSLKFLLIAVGGPVWGYLMARATILFFSTVYNDAVVEVSITLASAYLTFHIGEDVLGVSGILAVVLLSLTLKANSTCISPQCEEPLKHFWEVLGFLANTLLFFLIGLIIGRKAFERLEVMDFPYLFGLYAAVTLIRFLMLILLKPMLARLGYGFEWKTLLVVGWGGLRGAVGLCLALEVYEEPHFCDRDRLGPKILFHTAGIVLLTLLVNATTTKKLMEVLQLTTSSSNDEGSAYNIQDALFILENTRRKYYNGLQYLYPDFAMADWDLVAKFTVIPNEDHHKVNDKDVKKKKKKQQKTEITRDHIQRSVVKARILGAVQKSKISAMDEQSDSNFVGVVKFEASQESGSFLSRQEFEEEYRIRLLKAFKISFRRQYEQGVLHGVVMKFVLNTCDRLQDLPCPQILTSADVMARYSLGRNYHQLPPCFGSGRKIPKFSSLFKESEVERVHLSLEVGKGFVTAVDTVVTLLPRMLSDANASDLRLIKRILEREKYKTILKLGSLQVNYPKMVAAAKTKYAARVTLNQIKAALVDVRRDGLIERSEAQVLMLSLEALEKRLDKIPKTLGATSAEAILDNLSWFRKLGSPKICQYLKSQARILHFLPGDLIYKIGDLSCGIYLIITGLAKIRFVASPRLKMARERYGSLPICELVTDLTFKDSFSDLIGPGGVIGELGYLKEECRSSSVACETFLTTYFFPSELLYQAGQACLMSSSSEEEDFLLHLWASWGSRVGSALCQYLPKFQDWSKARIEGYMEGGLVLPIRSLSLFEIPEFVSDVVVIEGYFEDVDSKEVFIAPSLIPAECNRLFSKRNPLTVNRLLVVLHEDVSHDFLSQYLKTFQHSMYKSITNALGELEFKLEMEEEMARIKQTKGSTNIQTKSSAKRMDPRQRRLSLAIAATPAGGLTNK